MIKNKQVDNEFQNIELCNKRHEKSNKIIVTDLLIE